MGSKRRSISSYQTAFMAAICTAVLSIIYLPCLSGSAFTIDDESLIDIPQLKPGLSLLLLRTLFTPGNHIDFYPIRDLAYWMQIHLLNADPLGLNMTVYHLFSLCIFFGIVFFIGKIIERRTSSKLFSGILISLFAVLPFHSEMLMWASAQKDLLALLFGLIAVDQIDNWAYLKGSNLNSNWPLAIAFFALSFMSKASLVLLPPAIFLAFWLNLPQLETNKRRLALIYSTILTGVAIVWSMVQSRIYEDINDMRFFYPYTYRLQASMAALGREFVGILNPTINIVDVENWGTWLRYNSNFVPIGFAIISFAFILGIYALKKRKNALLLSLITFAALYLPTSGLIFQHRNFYSTRYLEPALIFGFLCLGCLISQIQIGRHWKQLTAGATLVLITMLYFSSKEAEAWSSARSVVEKSLSRHPDRLSLKAYLLTTLRQENQWGRLTSTESSQLRNLEQELENRCGLAPNSQQPSSQDERDDCMWTWMEIVLNPKSRGTVTFKKASEYLQAARAQLLPQKIKQLELRTEAIEASYGLRTQLSVDPKMLVRTSGYGATPQGRVRLIAALCLTDHASEATRLSFEYSSRHLIDRSHINEIFSNVSMNQLISLQSCFGLPRHTGSAQQ